MNRRTFLRALCGLMAGGLCPSGPLAAVQKDESKPFYLFNQLNFRNMPPQVRATLTDISVYYAAHLWPNKQVDEELHRDYIEAKFKTRKLIGPEPILCLDVEHWKYRRVSEEERAATIGKYLELISIFKSLYPHALIGLFEFFPTSFYPLYDQMGMGQIEDRLWSDWQKEQDDLASIASAVDIFFPQLYSKWPQDPDIWKQCAVTVLGESRKRADGKPVVPFIWPQYWLAGAALIAGDYWKVILDTVFEHADSAVIWSVYSSAPDWNEGFEWWQVTKAFVEHVNSIRPVKNLRQSSWTGQ